MPVAREKTTENQDVARAALWSLTSASGDRLHWSQMSEALEERRHEMSEASTSENDVVMHPTAFT